MPVHFRLSAMVLLILRGMGDESHYVSGGLESTMTILIVAATHHRQLCLEYRASNFMVRAQGSTGGVFTVPAGTASSKA